MDGDELPEILYHYTDAAGLMGILSGELWFTDIRFLNDNEEYKYAKNQINLAVQKKLKEFFSVSERDSSKQASFYTACFCGEKEHLLGMWRAYAANGNGYRVGFKLQNLFSLANNLTESWLNKVEYGDSLQKNLDLITEDLQKKYSPFTQLKEPLSILLSPINTHWFAFIKRPEFREEHECRWVVQESDARKPEIKHRTRNGHFIPYWPYKLPTEQKWPITEIVYGPMLKPERANNGLESLLAQKGYENVEIKESGLSYVNY